MPNNALPRLYALVYSVGDSTPGDHAALHAAAAFANRWGLDIHALLVSDAANAESSVLEARKAGAATISAIPVSQAGRNLQPQELVDLFIALMEEAAHDEPESAHYGLDKIILVGAGTMVEEAAGAIAARMGAIPLGRPLSMELGQQGTLQIVRSGYGGRLEITQELEAGNVIAALRRPEALATSSESKRDIPAVPVRIVHDPSTSPAYPVIAGPEGETEASLERARLIISGGRGMGGDQGFDYLRLLGRQLNAAVAGSLPAVDAGWTSVSRQVGQSGKYVSPDVYLAVGISGTPQHLAGIDPHTRIIAINNDPDAAIFQVASVGVIASWEEFLPALLEAVTATVEAGQAQ